jgi:hypothetical protein
MIRLLSLFADVLIVSAMLELVLHVSAGQPFSVILEKMLNSSAYEVTPEDYMTMASMSSDVTTSTSSPSGYLTLSFYQSGCSTNLAFQLAYPSQVCVGYTGDISEMVTVAVQGNQYAITLQSFQGESCGYLYYQYTYYIPVNYCRSPYQISFASALFTPSTGILGQ